MYLRTNLKLGQVNNLSDARYASAWGAAFLGFNFDPQHPQYISPAEVQEILGWIEGPQAVGEWGIAETEVIIDTCNRLELAWIQLNYYNKNQLNDLQEYNIIQNIEISDKKSFKDFEALVDDIGNAANFLMLSFENPEIQQVYLKDERFVNWLKILCDDRHVWLNWHFNPQNITEILDVISPYGINLNGSSEDKPGYKDFAEMNDLVEVLETEL